MKNLLKTIRQELEQNADSKRIESEQRFFKEGVKLYGVTLPKAQKIAKEYHKDIEKIDKKEIFGLCDKLWQSGYIEEAYIACDWSYFIHEKYEPEDFRIFEKWVHSYVSNWAMCDTLCNHTVGAFIERYPEFIFDLKKWAKSDNRWARRAAAVTFIIPARKGLFLKDIFEIADVLLMDEDDLVQKGYGWMLKAASQVHQKEVFNYVTKNKDKMPRTALRYAIEKMPKEMKEKAMKK